MQTTLKSSVLVLLAAGGVVIATPILSSRQANIITGAFTPIGGAFTNMDTSVKALTAQDSRTVTVVLQNGAVALQAMNDATNTVRTSTELRAFESRQVLDQTTNTNAQMSTFITDIVAQKLVLDQFGASPTVVNMLTQQKAANNALNDAVLGKFPNNRLQRDQVRDSMNKVNAAFDQGIESLSAGSAQPFTPPPAASPAPAAPAPAPAAPAPAAPAPAPAAPAPAAPAPAPAAPAPAAPAPAAPAPAPAAPAPAAPAPAAPAPAPAAPAPAAPGAPAASPAPFANPLASVAPFVAPPAASSTPIPFTQPQIGNENRISLGIVDM
ncbi:hypothetical protein MCOR32_000055 [Pyricularia oryzae]|nr:hypothetical protein MCOR30_008823 [Pyricularia oryzae]KAI6388646.1 hypothetical protein MCOR32_000055 [Pyricularia oryzae]KAI6576871.1 hypothetical protein MCOR09_000855 [Pyricularia oryzae]KAI6607761.1 hypothetical protein MCOR12_000182 [Pyricularia oryzae]